MNPNEILIIACGGAIGGIARFLMSSAINHWSSGTFPWGTLFVNLTGSLIIGLVSALLWPNFTTAEPRSELWLILVVGIIGSYTTASSFSLETLNMMRHDRYLAALLNIGFSLFSCLGAIYCGYWLGNEGLNL